MQEGSMNLNSAYASHRDVAEPNINIVISETPEEPKFSKKESSNVMTKAGSQSSSYLDSVSYKNLDKK